MPKAYWGEIKDPVHGYVYITENEKGIIDGILRSGCGGCDSSPVRSTFILARITRDLNTASA